MSAHLTVLLKAASVLLKSTLAGKHFRTFSLLQKKNRSRAIDALRLAQCVCVISRIAPVDQPINQSIFFQTQGP